MTVISTVESHTEGMPTRVVTDGVGTLPGATMAERRLNVPEELRTFLMCEPRGHGAMSGAILQQPVHPDADWGVVFIEVSGCLPMCGHGTIGVATVLVETGRVEVTEPETIVRLDVPAGLVEARVAVKDGRATAVTIRNVPSFFVGAYDGYDLAYGGNFYAIANAAEHGLTVRPEHARKLIDAGLELMATVPEPFHPRDPAIRGLKHVIWVGEDRSSVAIHPGWLDRSPCGTGTSARMAQLHARGELAIGQEFVHRSVIGTRFTGRLIEETDVGVIPEITGRAWITGAAQYTLAPDDPFPAGFRL